MALLLHPDPTQNGPQVEDPTRARAANRRSNPAPRTAPSLSTAAIHADAEASPLVDLAAIWQNFIDGRLRFHSADRTPSRQIVLARTGNDAGGPWASLSRIETAIVVRVLCGEQQKLVAAEFGIACSTASKWFTNALEKLNLDRTIVPLPLVTAAQSWALGRTPAVCARSGSFDLAGGSFFFLSVSKPIVGLEPPLTQSEREIAQRLIEGDSRWDIAAQRATSTQTVACQFRAVFSKLGLSGRYALIRRAADLGWFP